MDEKTVLRIETQLDTSGAQRGLQDFTGVLRTMMQQVNAIVAGIGARVKGLDKVATSVSRAGAAIKGAVASFDELNIVLQSSGGGGGGGAAQKPRPEEDPAIPALEALRAVLKKLEKALRPLRKLLEDSLQWVYDNVLVPLGSWTMNEAVPALVQMIAAAATLLDKALRSLQPLWQWLWDAVLAPLAQWSGTVFITAMDTVAAVLTQLAGWIDQNKGSFEEMWVGAEPALSRFAEVFGVVLTGTQALFTLWGSTLTDTLAGLLELWSALLAGSWEQAWTSMLQMLENGKLLLLESLAILWETVSLGFAGLWEAIQLIFAPVVEWMQQNLITPLAESFGWLWDGIVLGADIALNLLKGILQPLVSWLTQSIIAPVQARIKGLWDTILGYAQVGYSTLLEGVRGYIGNLLGFAAAGVNVIIGLINSIIGALNTIQVDIPEWVPKYGGRSFGISIPRIPEVTIPKLATGAVIPPNAQFLAMLGDQTHGKNLEAPENLIRQIVREEGGQGQSDQPLQVQLMLDGDIIYRSMVQRAEQQGYGIGGVFANAY